MNPKTYPVLPSVIPRTIVLYCGDPRFQAATRQFIAENLGLKEGDYVPVVVGGGVASLTEPMSLPKEFKYLRELFEFYFGHFNSIKHVVLINHEDCGKYRFLSEKLGPLFLQRFRSMSERQQHDLAKVGEVVLGLAPGLTIDRYYVKFFNSEHTEAVFEKQ